MFKGWSNNKKIVFIIGISILVLAIYNWKWIARKFGYNTGDSEYRTGGVSDSCTDNDPKTNGSCSEEPQRTSTGILIERVPERR